MELLKKKILHRSCYRGCKEMDKLLGEFAVKNIDYLSEEELQAFALLLEQNDPDIYDWIVYKKEPKYKFLETIISKIGDFNNIT